MPGSPNFGSAAAGQMQPNQFQQAQMQPNQFQQGQTQPNQFQQGQTQQNQFQQAQIQPNQFQQGQTQPNQFQQGQIQPNQFQQAQIQPNQFPQAQIQQNQIQRAPSINQPVPFGKRSIENITVSNSTETECEITSFESISSKLFCEGKEHNFECGLERHFSIEHMEHQLEELRFLPNEEPIERLSKTFILSVRPEGSMFNNFTMEHKNETMLFTLFHDKDFTDEGFRVKDLTCWKNFEKMMDQNEQVKLSMRLSF